MIAEVAPFVMVVLIILIVTIGKNRRAQYQALASRRDDANPEAERLAREVHRLNERLAVLERLATDPAKRLSAEIDALDDTKR